ncbi:hypothetical protein [Silvanigrella aquatica]|uniref:Uncharacterized protein n=1 Tax=Silvanigrella aquatica TaxID=1915309 RepID=A0A1L4D4X5_9BACT|nr:hypothetical protein [Silvanigrella aquatica]APJ05254.1 hypothetical protein AXG55_14625 [Silvanigrella aquatica]
MSLNKSKYNWDNCSVCQKEIKSDSKMFDFSYCSGSASVQMVNYIDTICYLCYDCGSSLEKISFSILDKEITLNKESLVNNETYRAVCNLCGNKHDNDHFVMSLTEMQLTGSGMNESSDTYKCIYICNSCNYHLRKRFHNNKEFKIYYNCNGIKFSSETPW